MLDDESSRQRQLGQEFYKKLFRQTSSAERAPGDDTNKEVDKPAVATVSR